MYHTGPSHALVRFQVDGCLCVVPRKHLVDADKVKNGKECQVKWGGNEVFTATVIAMGNTEEELLSGMGEGEERESQPPPKKTNTQHGKENTNKNTPTRKRRVARKPLTQVQNVSCVCVCAFVFLYQSTFTITTYAVGEIREE